MTDLQESARRMDGRPDIAIKVFRACSWCVVGIGVVGLCVVIVILASRWAWHAGTATAAGTVTSHASGAASRAVGPGANSRARRASHAEVVAFTDGAGVKHEFTSTLSTSRPFAIGASVPVRYTPSDPSDAVIDTWFRLWGFPLIFAGGAVVFIGFGAAMLVPRRRIDPSAGFG